MADANAPKKETVRIAVPPPQQETAARGSDTVRLQMPTRADEPAEAEAAPPASLVRPPSPFRPPPIARAPAAPSQREAAAPPPNLPPPPVIGGSAQAAPVPPPLPGSSGIYPGAAPMHAHPKKETARISILPDPPPGSRAPTVNMTKTQPLIKAPLAPAPHVPVTVAPTGGISGAIDAVPRALLWALLGISALIFLIQLWNYFSV